MGNKKGDISFKRKTEIINGLKTYLEKGTLLGMTNTELAKEFKITRQSIVTFKKEITNEFEPVDLNLIQEFLEADFAQTFRSIREKQVEASGLQEWSIVEKVKSQARKDYQDYLERWGIKAKAIENINLTTEADNKLQVTIVKSKNDIIEAESEEKEKKDG